MVEAIPKSTSRAIHPDALRVDGEAATPSDMRADYRSAADDFETVYETEKY
jgi:hypothetical protein